MMLYKNILNQYCLWSVVFFSRETILSSLPSYYLLYKTREIVQLEARWAFYKMWNTIEFVTVTYCFNRHLFELGKNHRTRVTVTYRYRRLFEFELCRHSALTESGRFFLKKTGVLGIFLEVGKKTLNLQHCYRYRHKILDVFHFTLSERLFFAFTHHLPTLVTKKGDVNIT